MKRFFLYRFFTLIVLYALTFNIPIHALESIPQEIEQYKVSDESLLTLTEQELTECIHGIYQKFYDQGITDQLPEEFILYYDRLNKRDYLEREDLLKALYSFLTWLNAKMVPQSHDFNHNELSNQLSVGFTRGGNNNCCTATKLLNQIIFLLIPIVRGIGNPGDTPCDQTIFGILGDACVTLSGQSISGALAQIETCCEATLSNVSSLSGINTLIIELNNAVTTLNVIVQELNDTTTTLSVVLEELNATATTIFAIEKDVQGTFTALNACCNSTFSAIADLKSTVTADFQFTWTILGSLTNCCNGTFSVLGNVNTTLGQGSSISGTLFNILNNTNTLTNCCAGTFSVLGNVGTILGQGATISGTLLDILNNTSSATTCCAGTFSVLGDVGVILGRGATISGTLLNVLQNTNTLTNCCAGTFSVLGNVGTILGQGSSISGTLLNILQNTNTLTTCCPGTFSVLGNVNTTLGQGSSISGTLGNIITTLVADFNATWTILGCSPFTITNTVTLTTGGSYCLANNLTFSSGNAITIAASNISVDLSQRTINGTGGGVNGIVINTGLNNITIQNGTIVGVSTDGIQTNSGVTNVTFNNLKILSTGSTGMNFIGAAPITNCLVTNCEIVNTVTGIYLQDCNNNTFQNCIVSTVTPVGVRLVGGQNNIFDSCTVENLSTLNTSDTSTLAGFWIGVTEQETNIRNCIISSSTVVGLGHPYGILMDELVVTGTLFDFVRTTTGTNVASAAWSPDGKFVVATSSTTNAVLLYQFNPQGPINLTLTSLISNVSANSLAWSPDGRFLAVGATNSTNIYQFTGVGFILLVTVPVGATFIAWSPNGNFIASVNGNTLRIFTFSGAIVATVAAINSSNTSVAWSPDSNYLSVTSFVPAHLLVPNTIFLSIFSFDGIALATVVQASLNPFTLAGNARWSPNGRYVAWVNQTGTSIYEFTGIDLNLITSDSNIIANGNGAALDWSRDGNYLLAGSAINGGVDAILYQFNLNSYSLVITASQFNNSLASVAAFNPNAQYALIGGVDGTASTGFLSILQTFTFPLNCVITNNQISDIRAQPLFFPAGFARGVGIEGSSANNLFESNILYNNDINTQGLASIVDTSELDQSILAELGNVSAILGQGATISGTLLNILQNISTLTTCCAQTFSFLNAIQCNPILIHNSDVGTTGYVISTSGVYKLAESITFSPAGAANAITITTSNVLLDLQCFSIAQGNAQAGVNGISIQTSGVSNVTVQNGKIANFTGSGIVASAISSLNLTGIGIKNCSTAININNSVGASNLLTFDDLEIISCGSASTVAAAVSINRVTNLIIENCLVNNTVGSSGTSSISIVNSQGITFNNVLTEQAFVTSDYTAYNFATVSDVYIKDCQSRRENATGSCTGMLISTGSGITVENCLIQQNSAVSSLAGIECVSTQSSLLKGIAILNCTSTNADVSAFSILTSPLNVVDCIISGNVGSSAFLGINLGSNNNLILRTTISNNAAISGVSGVCQGIFLQNATNNSIFDCEFSKNNGVGTTSAIDFSGANNNLIQHCTASLNASSADVCQGFLIRDTSSNNSIIQCEFFRNTGVNDANSFGVNVTSGTNNLFSQCRAYNNGTTVNNQLNGVPVASLLNLNTTNMNSATGPFGNVGIVP